ncbi:MAG: chorismate synthase, partial [Bacteroidia bacterium]
AKNHDVRISAYTRQIGEVSLNKGAKYYSQEEVDVNVVRCPDELIANQMIGSIELSIKEKDSLGGVIECVISGVKPGVGNPVFDKLHAKLGHAMLSINAVKGFEIGGGFDMSRMKGSEVNDEFSANGETIVTETNYSGGVQGGISNGMDIVFRVAFKPTATIGQSQGTVGTNGEDVRLEASGRHDPCVVPRAVPIVETLAALVLGDLIL